VRGRPVGNPERLCELIGSPGGGSRCASQLSRAKTHCKRVSTHRPRPAAAGRQRSTSLLSAKICAHFTPEDFGAAVEFSSLFCVFCAFLRLFRFSRPVGLARVLHSFSDGGSEAALHAALFTVASIRGLPRRLVLHSVSEGGRPCEGGSIRGLFLYLVPFAANPETDPTAISYPDRPHNR